MQGILEELIRWTGYGALRAVSFGRYRGGRPEDMHLEGAAGLGIALLLMFAVYLAWPGQ
jgi:hypothetical protein